MDECDQADKHESRCGTFAAMPKELSKAKKLKESIAKAMAELNERKGRPEEEVKVNRVDPDSVLVKGRQGTHSGYNMQSVVDDRNGLIVHADVVSKSNDLKQLAVQIQGA